MAALITLVTALNRRYLRSLRSDTNEVLATTEDVCDYVRDLFRYNCDEEVYLICLNGNRKVLSRESIGKGTPSSVKLSGREIAGKVLKHNASFVVLAHNHLTEIALPSRADVISTRYLRNALHLLDVELLDHIVVADGEAVSMRASGYLDE